MKIEMCNTLVLLQEMKQVDIAEKVSVWQERVESLFKPLKQVVPLDFSAMGACDAHSTPEDYQPALDALLQGRVIERIQASLEKAFTAFQEQGHSCFPETLQVGVFMSDRKQFVHEQLNHGFTGFGGIPGFIVLILSPTEYVLKSIEALAVHEFHHNLRFLIEPWPQDRNISVGKYLLDEGLAEACAATLFGEELIGPHTIGLSTEELLHAEKIILPNVREKGFQQASSYLFGDSLADLYGFPKRGLPHGAGYAVGYHLVKKYFQQSGGNIFTATLKSSDQILKEIGVVEVFDSPELPWI